MRARERQEPLGDGGPAERPLVDSPMKGRSFGANSTRINCFFATMRCLKLAARRAHPRATLADLYDPDVMPSDLRKAHKVLDLAVERLYRTAPFNGDRERVEHLFMLYEKMTADLFAETAPKRKNRRSRQ